MDTPILLLIANSCADCVSHLLVPSTNYPAEKGNKMHATNCLTLLATARDNAT